MIHNIVIPLHSKGGKFKNNTETRYALRGIERHFKGEYQIAIVSNKLPEWAQGIELVDDGGKGLKTALLKAAARFPDGFFWWYDDCVLIKDQTPEEIQTTIASKKWTRAQTKWGKSLEKIRERLEAEGMKAWDYSRPHGPYWFDKAMVDEAFTDWPGMKGKFPWESWILSKHDWPRRHGNYKQYYGKFNRPPNDSEILVNWCDRGLTNELQGWLKERFPEASRFEKPAVVKPIAATPSLKNLRYVYINMEEDTGRRESFLREFPYEGWWRFPGCRGGLMWGEVARGMGLLGNLREFSDQKLKRPKWGTFGCSLSHIFCLRLATVADGIVLFPDDATNTQGRNIADLVEAALKNRPDGVGWIKLKNHQPLYVDEPHVSGGWTFRRLSSTPRPVGKNKKRGKAENMGSAAVIILKEQAKAILSLLPPLTSSNIDWELRAIMDEVPGGCWEMLNTGVKHASKKPSVRKRIDNRR